MIQQTIIASLNKIVNLAGVSLVQKGPNIAWPAERCDYTHRLHSDPLENPILGIHAILQRLQYKKSRACTRR